MWGRDNKGVDVVFYVFMCLCVWEREYVDVP